MSAHESATHTVANIGMLVFAILAILTAALLCGPIEYCS
ncbi:hypothetical protein SAMN05660745_02132 [Corynebacterium glucuronolyticum]|nr:hypothetical protein SAMN05660745_02132 [Corynebacterium glucuronolyticum]